MPQTLLPARAGEHSPLDEMLMAFLAEKLRRSGSRRTVEGYSRMLFPLFARLGKAPDQRLGGCGKLVGTARDAARKRGGAMRVQGTRSPDVEHHRAAVIADDLSVPDPRECHRERFFDMWRWLADEMGLSEILQQPNGRAVLLMDRGSTARCRWSGGSPWPAGPNFDSAAATGLSVKADALDAQADQLSAWGISRLGLWATVEVFDAAAEAATGPAAAGSARTPDRVIS